MLANQGRLRHSGLCQVGLRSFGTENLVGSRRYGYLSNGWIATLPIAELTNVSRTQKKANNIRDFPH